MQRTPFFASSTLKCADSILPNDFLLSTQRLVRRPLESWIDDLQLQAVASAESEKFDPSALATVFNLAALLHSSAGDLAGAKKLCRDQLAWLARLLRHGCNERAELCSLALQPWINLGRLRIRQNDPIGAKPYFMLLGRIMRRERLVMDSVVVHPPDWESMEVHSPEIRRFLASVEIIDGTRAHLLAGALREGLDSLQRLAQAISPSVPIIASEAEAMLWVRLGAHRRARQSLECIDCGSNPLELLAVRIHETAIEASCFRRSSDLRTPVLRLVVLLTETDSINRGDVNAVRVLPYLARLLAFCDERTVADWLLERAFARAETLNDEPLAFAIADEAGRMLTIDEEKRWGWRRSEIAKQCLYIDVLRRADFDEQSIKEQMQRVQGRLLKLRNLLTILTADITRHMTQRS